MNCNSSLLSGFACLCLLTDSARCSAEGDVFHAARAITISTTGGAYSYQFAIELDKDLRLAALTASYKDTKKPVPKEELPVLKDVDLRQAYVLSPNDGPPTPASIILIVPFEQEYRKDPGSKTPDDDRASVCNVIRLIFHEGKLLRWEKAVSLGEESNSWSFSSKDKGEPEEDGGKEIALANPYWTRNTLSYSTPWKKTD